MNQKKYNSYLKLLKDEMVPATGCTEPIALAYAGAVARANLGMLPESIDLVISRNILKNVKSVIVPNTGGLKGIYAAVSAGVVSGDPSANLEVLSKVNNEDVIHIQEFLKKIHFSLVESDNKDPLYISVTLRYENHSSTVKIIGEHTNISYIEKDGNILKNVPYEKKDKTPIMVLSLKDIFDFSNNCKIEDIKDLVLREINDNMAIAKEAFEHDYGANIGKLILKTSGDSVISRAKAYPASASDARMSGCDMPVVISSGSGNQGLTVSLPVLVYAKELKVSDDALYRALIMSNLVNLHLKSGIGRLSAFCGATCAGVAAASGISMFYKNDLKTFEHVIINGLVINSGLICDGAKPSCAAKIASSVEAGLLGLEMTLNGSEFHSGDGIVFGDAEKTIKNIGIIATRGMRKTDEEIAHLVEKNC